MCDPKKRVKRDDEAEDWKIDTLDEDDDTPSVLAPRFFNLAKRNLEYTHTEAGFRTPSQLDEELWDLGNMMKEAERSREQKDLGWLMDDEGGDD